MRKSSPNRTIAGRSRLLLHSQVEEDEGRGVIQGVSDDAGDDGSCSIEEDREQQPHPEYRHEGRRVQVDESEESGAEREGLAQSLLVQVSRKDEAAKVDLLDYRSYHGPREKHQQELGGACPAH